MQFYQQPLDPNLHVSAMEGFCDATVVTSTTSSGPCTRTTILSQSSSYTNPKPNSNASKPIRKRSRSSKRTPITLLNANTTNFRALVQQFTGCPSSATMSFGVHKGPITLNFQQGRRQAQRNTTRTLTTLTAPFGNTCNYDSQVIHQQPADQPQLLQNLHQQSINNSLMPSMELSDGLLMDHNFSLHDQTMNNAFSNDVKHDGYFMWYDEVW